MNAITQYMHVLKADNENLLIFSAILFICSVAIIFLQLVKIDSKEKEIRDLSSDIDSIKKERDQLSIENIRLRKENNQAELSKLKKQLEFALKNPPKFPVGTKISINKSISEIEIKFPGVVQHGSFVLKALFGGIGSAIKGGLPKPYYVYHIKASAFTYELLEHQVEELQQSNKKSTKKPRKNGNKKASPSGIKKS